MADLGDLARQSLMAVEAWTQTINANMIGANKVAYKNTRVSFGAGNVQVVRPPSGQLMPIQFTQPTMSVVQTSVEWVPGNIATSTEATHFAIRDRKESPGTNFFVLQDPNNPTKFFLSRDGEFHFASMTVKLRNPANPDGNIAGAGSQFVTVSGDFLVNTYGLLVIGSGNRGFKDGVGGTDPIGAVNGGDILQAYGTAALAEDGAPTTGGAVISPALFGGVITRDNVTDDPFDAVTNGVRATGLSFVNTTVPQPPGSSGGYTIRNPPAVVNVKNPQNLVFSRYGSTIYDFSIVTSTGESGGFNPIANDYWDFDSSGTGARPVNFTPSAGPGSLGNAPPGSTARYKFNSGSDKYIGNGPYADRVEKALEQSNASITTLIPELTLAQKMFTAVSKLITVYGNNIDTLNNLIR